MTPAALLELYRDEMSDAVEPYLWSDDLIAGYFHDAQQQYCRHTYGIPDSLTTAVVDLSVVPATDAYALHPAVLQIRSARRGDNGRPVEVVNQEDMPTRGMYFDGNQGPVKVLITGMDEGAVRVHPVPNETMTVKLSVFRLPIVEITGDNLDTAVFEVPPQHHLGLMLWAKHRGYSKQDAETFDKSKAADFETRFLAYCERVKREQDRLRHKPRAVVYGGI